MVIKGLEFSYVKWIMPIVQYLEKMIMTLNTPCVDQEQEFHDFWTRSLPLLDVSPKDEFLDDESFRLDENEDHYHGLPQNLAHHQY